MAKATETDPETFGEWPLKRLMTEVCGSGPKSADDMSRAQATEAIRRIFAGEPDQTTLGAFWLSNRWKRNNPEELGAYVDEMCARVESVAPDADPVDCGANYDGKGDTAILGAAAGIVAAAAGTPVVAHSGDRVPTQKQDSYKHVLDELGVRTELAPDASAEMVDETGFGFYYQPAFNPAVQELWDRRDMMGVRTFVNTIETLANPADADVHLGSFYHLALMEGYDDIRPGYTKVAEWEQTDGEASFTDYEIETPEYDMAFEEEDLEVDDVAVDSATLTEAVVTGERDDHWADAVALNAGVRIYAGGDADSIAEGIDQARAAIDDGDAEAVLAELRAF
jgi:anthranilate phosphoribosyltransferase